MKFYIASKLENYRQVRELSGLLKAAGWTHNYDWTTHGSVKEDSVDILAEIGQKEYEGVRDADILIVLTPQGRGTHTEFGIAIGLGKEIYLCHSDDTYFKPDDNTSAFYWLPQVKQFRGTTTEIAEKILQKHK
jgi:nucleoside 2-deoxyribosyltransferase